MRLVSDFNVVLSALGATGGNAGAPLDAVSAVGSVSIINSSSPSGCCVGAFEDPSWEGASAS